MRLYEAEEILIKVVAVNEFLMYYRTHRKLRLQINEE